MELGNVRYLLSSVFIDSVTEISNNRTFETLKDESLFLLNDKTYTNIISLKYMNYKLIEFRIGEDLERNILKNIDLSKKRKSFSIDILCEKNVNIISLPVQKKNGEMIFFITLVTAWEPNEIVILLLEMLANGFYKNFTLEYIMHNLKIPETIDNRFLLKFSDKEKRISELLIEGYEDKQICSECNISISTLRKYISSIFNYLNARNRTEFVNKYNIMKISHIYDLM